MNKIIKAVLCILKNATIVIPLVEGVVYSIQNLVNPPKKDDKDVETSCS